MAAIVSVRSILRLDLPTPATLLVAEALPVETFGVAWSELAIWPARFQHSAVSSLLRIVGGLIGTCALVATANTLLLLLETVASRSRELAVRGVVGATPRALALMLLSELRRFVFVALALGFVLGGALGWLARMSWPDPGNALPLGVPLDLAVSMTALFLLLCLSYLGQGLSGAAPARFVSHAGAAGRVTDQRSAVFVRRALAAGHMGVVGTVLLAALTLAGGTPESESTSAERGDTIVLASRAPESGAWSELVDRVTALEGVRAAGFAGPGAVLGLGIVDVATAECGRCSRGGLPSPL